ncbi:MAG: hypothetical protein MUO40_09410, partial [Anaerolineaceae bacterium]|nr:hypothetical protein [Anaerolineaceae bacterium]
MQGGSRNNPKGMTAIVESFRKNSRDEAKRNIKEAYNIFEEHNDKDGSKICDAFYDALIKNDPDAWMEIIKDKNNLSCPIYRLLKEGSERKIKDMVMPREHFSQIESRMIVKPGSIDEMKNYLKKFLIGYNYLFQIRKLKYFLMDMMTIQILFLSIM